MGWTRWVWTRWAIVLWAVMVGLGPAMAAGEETAAAGPQGLTLELNNVRDQNGGCRMIYLIYNGTATALDQISYEAVVFDKESRVSQYVLLDFGNLPPQKTRVVQFDIVNMPCANISRLLINNVSRCSAKTGTLPLCLDGLTTRTRTPIVFGV